MTYIVLAVISAFVLGTALVALFLSFTELGLMSTICMVLAPTSALAPTWYLQGMDTTSNWSAILWVVCSVGSLGLFVGLGLHFSDKYEKR
jgi:hypothetical protein